MGITGSSTGRRLLRGDDMKLTGNEIYISLAGNPNVGKSTVFNALTGMNQHTGNWTGKTVSTARGRTVLPVSGKRSAVLTDLPGTYSLMAHSAEEAVARDNIAFGGADVTVIVCDASCLERNLNLVLQVLEITSSAVVCVNLADEAEKKSIYVDCEKLSVLLGVPVCMTSARSGRGLEDLKRLVGETASAAKCKDVFHVDYGEDIEAAVSVLSAALEPMLAGKLSARFAALRLLERCSDIIKGIEENICPSLSVQLFDESTELGKAYREACKFITESGMDTAALRDETVTRVILEAEKIADCCVTYGVPDHYERDRRIDRILTHRVWGVPVMAAMLALIFYITLTLADYPSQWLSSAFASLGVHMRSGLEAVGAGKTLVSLLMDGIYNTLTWVVSVMLPPMAIFFPMFTLLEDVGYLPRAAFNLDRWFRRSGACGKQALTMAMGLGCNAAGITGCRIIDSPRERLIAMLTNVFMPCNGRLPHPL